MPPSIPNSIPIPKRPYPTSSLKASKVKQEKNKFPQLPAKKTDYQTASSHKRVNEEKDMNFLVFCGAVQCIAGPLASGAQLSSSLRFL